MSTYSTLERVARQREFTLPADAGCGEISVSGGSASSEDSHLLDVLADGLHSITASQCGVSLRGRLSGLHEIGIGALAEAESVEVL